MRPGCDCCRQSGKSTPVAWKDVRFQVDFFNPKGEFFDTGQQEIYTWRLPASEETPFKVSLHRQFPQKEYASYKVRWFGLWMASNGPEQGYQVFTAF